MVNVLTDDNFEQVVSNSQVPVLVDFYADWCGPCKMAGPIVAQIAEEVGEAALVCKINVDENPNMSSAFGVTSIPCFVSFKGGKEVNRQVGFSGKESIKKMILD